MIKCIHKVNITLMILLMTIDLALIAFYGVKIYEIFQSKTTVSSDDNSDLIVCFLSLILNIISVIITLILGCHALVFQILNNLLAYVLVSPIFYLATESICLFNFFELFESQNKIQITEIIIITINSLKCLFGTISVILCCIERNQIIKDLKDSPLNLIDESITESLYKNIIGQSQSPGDPKLTKEYKNLTKKKTTST